MAEIVSAIIAEGSPRNVIVTFDEPIMGSVKEDYSLSSKTIENISISTNGLVLTITVTADYIPEEVVTLTYTKPESNKLRSARIYDKNGSGDYLQVINDVVGSEIFTCPNTQDYIDADTDFLWFKEDETQRQVAASELVGYDFSKTLVKYSDTSPYILSELFIIDYGQTLTTEEENKIRDKFCLSIWWSNVLSSHGRIKGNKPVPKKYIFTYDPDNLVASIISGGVKLDWTHGTVTGVEVHRSIGGAAYSIIATLNAGIYTYSDLSTELTDKIAEKEQLVTTDVIADYKVVSRSSAVESNVAGLGYSLGSELVDQDNWYKAAYWDYLFEAAWSQVDTHLHSTGAGFIAHYGIFSLAKKYRCQLILANNAGATTYGMYNGAGDVAILTGTGTKVWYHLVGSDNNLVFIYNTDAAADITGMSIKEATLSVH